MSQTPFLCPTNVALSEREVLSQSFICLSCDDVAITLSFGDTRQQLMYFEWAMIVIWAAVTSWTSVVCFGIDQTFRVLSWPTDAKKLHRFGAK